MKPNGLMLPAANTWGFEPSVSFQYGRLLRYTAIFSGELAVTRRPVGRCIRTATVIYLALSSEQPPLGFWRAECGAWKQ